MENTHKHPGFKWQVDTAAPHGCELGFEGGTVAIDAYSILYHAFGVNAIEFESRFHSQVALLRQCKPDNVGDKGYVFVDQHGDYGQVVIPYQGTVMPYPNAPSPGYVSRLGPYFTDDCVGPVAQCRSSLQLIRDRNLNVNSTWTSKNAHRVAPSGSTLIAILFRVRDGYQVFDWNDQEYPFTYRFVCGNAVYNPIGCRWNNTTTTVHEVQVAIPASWDNLAGSTRIRALDGLPRMVIRLALGNLI
jgi:hypothetical protein